MLKYVTRDLHAIGEALLVEYVTDVVLHGAHTDVELRGDLFVAQAARHRNRDSLLGIS